jgi:hypothetical protein
MATEGTRQLHFFLIPMKYPKEIKVERAINAAISAN